MIRVQETSNHRMDQVMDRRPRLLMVYADSVYAVHCSRYFRRHGWDVHLAASGDEACESIGWLAPTAVIVDGELPRDHAWDTCARIMREHPGLRVVVATPDDSVADLRNSAVGAAAVVSRRQGVEGLAEQLFGASCA